MTIEKPRSESPAAKARNGAAQALGPARRPARAKGDAAPAKADAAPAKADAAAKVDAAPAKADAATAKADAATAKGKATFEGALMHVIRLAQATLNESRSEEARAAATIAASGEQKPSDPASTAAQTSLERALDGLDAEVALKLHTLMIAGRDGKTIGDVNVNLALGDSKAALAAAAIDTSQNGPLLADYLRRGHALACASALDLERPIANWARAASSTLDERAWLSFGKHLARAGLDDWRCLAFVDSNQAISRLYLRLEGHAWWAFQGMLDRPTASVVEKQERALSSRRSKGLSTHSLSSLASRLSSTEGRAIRRAARAIRARVGDAVAP